MQKLEAVRENINSSVREKNFQLETESSRLDAIILDLKELTDRISRAVDDVEEGPAFMYQCSKDFSILEQTQGELDLEMDRFLAETLKGKVNEDSITDGERETERLVQGFESEENKHMDAYLQFIGTQKMVQALDDIQEELCADDARVG